MDTETAEADRVDIIGAGIGGLSLALALQQRGLEVRIHEQAPELAEVGAGLSVSPNATRVLEALGLGPFLEAHANEPLVQRTHHGLTGEDLIAIDRRDCRDDYGAAYYQLHRADLHGELVARVRGNDPDCLTLGRTLERVERGEAGLRLHFAGGDLEHVTLLVGADGLRSRVRADLFDDSEAIFTGQMAWRGLIPAGQLPGWAVERESHNWIGPGRTFVTYPIRGSELVNFVGFARSEAWVEESWSTAAEPGEVRAAFEDWCEPVMTVIDAVDRQQCFRWGLFSRAPLPHCTAPGVVLIGDAAHPMLPFFGQGASSTIEDAMILARCMAADGASAAALDRYDRARSERTATLQRESNLGAERLQGLDPYVLRDQPVRNEDSLGIFRYDPLTVAI